MQIPDYFREPAMRIIATFVQHREKTGREMSRAELFAVQEAVNAQYGEQIRKAEEETGLSLSELVNEALIEELRRAGAIGDAEEAQIRAEFAQIEEEKEPQDLNVRILIEIQPDEESGTGHARVDADGEPGPMAMALALAVCQICEQEKLDPKDMVQAIEDGIQNIIQRNIFRKVNPSGEK